MIARLQRPRLALALGLVFAFAAIGRGAWAEPAGQGADLILVNGSVSTPSGWSQAVAIRGGVILAVGESPAIKALASPGAKVVDLAGATVLPGLDDSHVHPLFAGLEQFACGFAPGA